MDRIRSLGRAPIVEAVIDFRVAGSGDLTAETIDSAIQGRAFGYRRKGPIIRGRFEAQFAADPDSVAQPPSTMTSVIGTRLHSEDEKFVAQFSTEGFTLSRLEPYQDWNRLIEEAKRVWPIYLDAVAPGVVTRVATRFINNLRLPLRAGDSFGRYLTQQPNFPSDVPQAMAGFLQRFVMHDARTDAKIIVTYALEETVPGGELPVIVDIDASKDLKASPSSDELWHCLEDLRKLKNGFFFASLTDEALELYA